VTSTDPQPDTPPFAEIDVLWITAGLGCDGDTISVTAATQPSLEDILLGGIPWIPKVNFHNPVLAYANGEDFLKPFHRAVAGNLSPFILVIEGSSPAIGLIAWRPGRGRLSPQAPVPPTAAFMQWREIRQTAWDFPTI
jgi:hypothetical protein